ncbi:ferredoxin [Nocardia sp. MDA0666]|uniref:ferredoxin n=1 Tax=Nocardia sp. MDA0666 TaxID=2135448 RepID=UPI000D11D099|nr:ferredoxin [Nocardia sp. MDA0666]PSR69297.1 ferredoxin [Nocardia sp. MDA0666]
MTLPMDERLRATPMRPVHCAQCGARVLARKSSRAQTSIQWDAASAAACVERHTAEALSGKPLPHCSQLRESIWAAARTGELPVLDEAPPG